MSGGSFFSELKRRKVYRTGAGYVIGSLAMWGAAEVASQAFGLSDRLLQVVIILTFAGLPLALFGAWVFEVRLEERRWPRIAGLATISAVSIVLGVALVAVLRPTDVAERYRLLIMPLTVRGPVPAMQPQPHPILRVSRLHSLRRSDRPSCASTRRKTSHHSCYPSSKVS